MLAISKLHLSVIFKGGTKRVSRLKRSAYDFFFSFFLFSFVKKKDFLIIDLMKSCKSVDFNHALDTYHIGVPVVCPSDTWPFL